VHELAICQAVVRQVLAVAASRPVGRITLRIGPLSGVEPDLLRHAFPLVAAGTSCESAVIAFELTPVEVCCQVCGATSPAPVNRLLCAACGAWRVTIARGDEMLLVSVDVLDAALSETKDLVDV
jgi:hydrogenase nickel incorporation protein HypA/HybF